MQFKISVLLFLSFLSLNIAANPFDEKLICKGEIKKLVNIETSGEWRNTFPDNVLFHAMRFHPQKLGNWIEIQNSSKIVVVRKFDGQKFNQYSFDEKCKMKDEIFQLPRHLTDIWKNKTIEDFDDEQLRKLVDDKGKKIFYLWSPTFSYSVEFYPYAEEYSRKMGASFIPLLDPSVNKIEALAALNRSFEIYNSKKNNSINRKLANSLTMQKNYAFDFYMRFGFSHYPVMYLSQNGKIHPRWMTGVMTKNGFIRFSNQLFKELR